MPSLYLCIDFGSTFTKAVAIDSHTVEILAKINLPTTLKKGIQQGHLEIIERLKQDYGIHNNQYLGKYACSSAAGGLRMIVSGLVPKLTTEAANRAALGAGAKVVKTFSYELTNQDINLICDERPDILLISGGLDGGEKRTAIYNATQIANNIDKVPIIYAGNRSAIDEIKKLFVQENDRLFIADNVLASIDEIDVGSAQELIRKVFLKQIIKVKGLNLVQSEMDQDIIPTPSAVLKAAEHLSTTTFFSAKGVMVIDPGGATTDVHSVAPNEPGYSGRIFKGLPEKKVKRTVEADLGVRENVNNLIQEINLDDFPIINKLNTDTFFNIINKFHQKKQTVPQSEEEKLVDSYLARTVVEIATQRHAGMIKKVWLPVGEQIVQYGKDFSELSVVIGTGGVVIHSPDPAFILSAALADEKNAAILKPKSPQLFLDASYTLFAVGLLSDIDPKLASNLAERYLKPVG